MGKEVAESGNDFASSLALGGVIGSKFTALVEDTVGLDWRKFQGWRPHWEHWISLYNNLKLYEGEYLNLYDTAWETPEAHVVSKDGELYYGFFAKSFSGKVPLRGLKDGVKYTLTDYANGDTPLGETIGGLEAALECQVIDQLLVRATPVQ